MTEWATSTIPPFHWARRRSGACRIRAWFHDLEDSFFTGVAPVKTRVKARVEVTAEAPVSVEMSVATAMATDGQLLGNAGRTTQETTNYPKKPPARSRPEIATILGP